MRALGVRPSNTDRTTEDAEDRRKNPVRSGLNLRVLRVLCGSSLGLTCLAAIVWGAPSASSQAPAPGAVERRNRLYVTSAASALVEQGLAAAAPTGAEASAFQPVPHPGVRLLPNVARATNVPWIDSSGWRFQRGLEKASYTKLPAGSAPLAAAEAFTFNVDAILNPDPADVEELGRMLQFLRANDQPPLPAMANIGVVDDRSDLMAEVLNTLTRRNLLYRVVSARDPALGLTVQLGTPDFPRNATANPNEFAARVRAKLGDDNRLVRLYGTSTVIARLTGDGKRARLYLLSFDRNRRRQADDPQAIRVRLLGRYRPAKLAAFGAGSNASLTDLRHTANTTEFWVPSFNAIAIIDLDPVSDPAVLESAYSPRELDLEPDPQREEWRNAPRVVVDRDKAGQPIPGPPTGIRSRWTNEHLYLLYICPYDELNLKPDPAPGVETPRLWNWDVAEAFIGTDFERIGRYKEFQVSPQSEWVDLEINRENPNGQAGMKWNSGYAVKGRIDAGARVWYGMMRIPFRAIDTRPPQPGRELRIGLFRIAGVNTKTHYSWRPTGSTTFHVPEAFGTLRLIS
jgi:hypothetical protein